MKFLKTLFGSKPTVETFETYKDFRIIVDPFRKRVQIPLGRAY